MTPPPLCQIVLDSADHLVNLDMSDLAQKKKSSDICEEASRRLFVVAQDDKHQLSQNHFLFLSFF